MDCFVMLSRCCKADISAVDCLYFVCQCCAKHCDTVHFSNEGLKEHNNDTGYASEIASQSDFA